MTSADNKSSAFTRFAWQQTHPSFQTWFTFRSARLWFSVASTQPTPFTVNRGKPEKAVFKKNIQILSFINIVLMRPNHATGGIYPVRCASSSERKRDLRSLLLLSWLATLYICATVHCNIDLVSIFLSLQRDRTPPNRKHVNGPITFDLRRCFLISSTRTSKNLWFFLTAFIAERSSISVSL